LKTKVNRKDNGDRKMKRYIAAIGVGLLVLCCLEWMKQWPGVVERYYSLGFYPLFSYVPKTLFGWIPFSVGDMLYATLVVVLCGLFLRVLIDLCKGRWRDASTAMLRAVLFVLGLYIYFYISWGLHYYRVPLQEQFGLQVDRIDRSDYLTVLDRYVDEVNVLRAQLDTGVMDTERATRELEAVMRADDNGLHMLSRTQVRVKHPISSKLASYFTVTGYLNPFTQEVQVNALMPKTAYPFTVVHELSHQMGIGFEDECNFIAFLVLHQHPDIWYRYAAYYETVQYLLRPLYYEDKGRYDAYVAKLSVAVKRDMEQERLFWQAYRGPLDRLMNIFYSGYLQHNNQPEGMARYSLMSRLVVAWEMQKAGTGTASGD